MKESLVIVLIAIGMQFNAWSQDEINNYKYVIVPNQFEFLSSKDQYQINSLTKFLFNKYGYTAFLEDDELPEDLKRNRCLALRADVNKVKGGFLKTKIQISLLNCENKVVADSKVGETREKKFEDAYNLALRDAFQTFQNFSYAYQPNSIVVAKNSPNATVKVGKSDQTAAQMEIQRLKEEVKSLKNTDRTDVAQVEKQLVKVESAPNQIKKETSATSAQTVKDLLYAQPLPNGFQIVDTEPKKVMILLNTNMQDTFLVKGKDAMVYKKGDTWIYESYDGDSLQSKTLNLKF